VFREETGRNPSELRTAAAAEAFLAEPE